MFLQYEIKDKSSSLRGGLWQPVLNYSHICIKLQADSNILASPEAGWGNCLPYVLAPPSLSCESER